MRIGIFLPDVRGGGAEKIMVEFANFLVENTGDSVVLILGKNQGSYLSIINPSVEIINLNRGKTFLAIIPLYFYLKKNKVDVLYSTLMKANLISIIVCNILKIKVIIREASTIEGFKKFPKSASSKLSLFLARCLYKYSDKCIAISNFVKGDLIAFTNCTPNRIAVIYNPIMMIDNLKSIELKQDYFHIGLVSRLTALKNIASVCKIIEYFLDKPYKIKFHFFGTGDSSLLLEDLMKRSNNSEIIELHGFELSYFSYIKHMQLFLHLSLWEGLGNSVLEVFNSGIPMVLSDVNAGYSELIKKEYPNIHYFKPLSQIEDICELIEKYLGKEIAICDSRIKLNYTKGIVYEKYRMLATND